MKAPITVNPLDKDKDILGKSFAVVQCEGSEHQKSNNGCVCYLIGRKVTLKSRHESFFCGTATFNIKGSTKRVRLSELGMPDRFN